MSRVLTQQIRIVEFLYNKLPGTNSFSGRVARLLDQLAILSGVAFYYKLTVISICVI